MTPEEATEMRNLKIDNAHLKEKLHTKVQEITSLEMHCEYLHKKAHSKETSLIKGQRELKNEVDRLKREIDRLDSVLSQRTRIIEDNNSELYGDVYHRAMTGEDLDETGDIESTYNN